MSSVVEMLANKKKPQAQPASVILPILPVLQKEHEGECGDNCACGGDETEGGCCGG